MNTTTHFAPADNPGTAVSEAILPPSSAGPHTPAADCAGESTRSASLVRLLQRLDAFIGFCENQGNILAGKAGDKLRKVVNAVRRARREFEAHVYFVAVCGPVKAGKSTLANLLARGMVSPVGREECTRRPSIIMAPAVDGGECIEVFHDLGCEPAKARTDDPAQDKATSEEAHRARFDKIVDYLRGISTADEMRRAGNVTCHQYALSPNNVEKFLASDLEREPLVVVIRTRNGKLLRENMAVVDMPGLDGAEAGTLRSVFHEWVIRRADFLLFVQSSIAVLSGQAAQFLSEILGGRHRNIPLRLIHNIIDGKHWRSRGDREADERASRVSTERELRLRLKLAGRIDTASVNLAKAWDKLVGPAGENAPRDDGGFRTFEQDLLRILGERRAFLHDRTCVADKLANTLKDARRELSQFRETCRAQREESEQQRQRFEEGLAAIAGITYSDLYERVLHEFELAVRKQQQAWMEAIKTDSENARGDIKVAIPGAMLKKRLTRFAETAAGRGPKQHFSPHTPLLRQFCENLDDELSRQEKTRLDAARTALGDLAQVPDPPRLNPERVEGLAFPNADFDLGDVLLDRVRETRRSVKTLWIKRVPRLYTADKVTHLFTQAVEAANDQVQARVESWLGRVRVAVSDYAEARRKRATDAIVAAREENDRRRRQEEARIAPLDQLAEAMLDRIEELERARQDALAAFHV